MVLGAPFTCALAIVLVGLPLTSPAQAHSRGQATSGTSTKSGISATGATSGTTTSASSLCEARTINYITHTLPQSCLKSSWAGSRPAPSQNPATSATHRSNGTSEMGTIEAQPVAAAPSSETQSAEAAATSFMSFEDWKEMMLRRAGQDPQEWRSRKPSQQQTAEKNPPDAAHHAGLGEEDEISLNFGEYKGSDDKASSANNAGGTGDGTSNLDATLVYGDAVVHRSKDAGKTCKERFSYASFDAGATILKTAAGAQNARAILVENKDTYMLLECAAPSKYVIVELSDDILIDTVVLANFEFFSSMIRHFRVSVSDRYPVKEEKWLELGRFEARNYRDIQPFLVENPQIWAKYVRIEFLTHYGNEYYCPVSLLRIHGSRMLDSWKDSETGREEDAQQLEGQESIKEIFQADTTLGSIMPTSEEVVGNASLPADVSPRSRHLGSNPFDAWVATCRASESQFVHPPTASQTSDDSPGSPTPRQSTPSAEKQQRQATATPKSASPGSSETPEPAPSTVTQSSAAASSGDASTAGGNASGASTTASPAAHETARERSGNATAATVTASPTVQEGFFNAITKRLQQVESNLTLSLKYVEDQSRHVQEALLRGEQKQHSKITQFLDDLNRTVLSELRNVRDQYDQIWQSTVLSLESQADRSERDMMALSARLNLLADEVVFQKRMAIVQAVILLSCLFLVIFSRGVSISSFAPPPAQSTTGTVYDEPPVRHDDVYRVAQHRWRNRPAAHDDADFAQSIPATEESAGSAPCESPLSAHLPGNLEGTPPEYHSLSPPLTPGLPDQPRPSHMLASGRELYNSESNPARRLPCLSHINSRKPLPSLPEHPSPPHES
ncbi:Sad1/UNC domain-containing protein [Hirsutella rhossiliensis]|uniref:Sad1/UNC domain-containing protein n=1 Tax=Hirsutella rhossiliensis TaxID=111463 RepID=A0A9P8MSB5_9HYPO|nr:Sad1/UNC domain-containing protein [Hirsutella rhossiliensis]KAH0960512.1 Sad1/UNC domain-containing protein [Hirsutella rhossiliensis]